MQSRLLKLQNAAFAARVTLAEAFRSAGHDVTPEEWATLSILGEDPGLTPSKLAAKATRDQTTVTRMIDRLVHKSLVERRADPKDRRVQRLFLSRTGYETHAELREIAENAATYLFAENSQEALSKFDTTLAGIIEKFNSSVK